MMTTYCQRSRSLRYHLWDVKRIETFQKRPLNALGFFSNETRLSLHKPLSVQIKPGNSVIVGKYKTVAVEFQTKVFDIDYYSNCPYKHIVASALVILGRDAPSSVEEDYQLSVNDHIISSASLIHYDGIPNDVVLTLLYNQRRRDTQPRTFIPWREHPTSHIRVHTQYEEENVNPLDSPAPLPSGSRISDFSVNVGLIPSMEELMPPMDDPIPPVDDLVLPIIPPVDDLVLPIIPPVNDPAPPAIDPIPPVNDPIPPAIDPIPPMNDPVPPTIPPIPPMNDPVPPTIPPIPPIISPAPSVNDPIRRSESTQPDNSSTSQQPPLTLSGHSSVPPFDNTSYTSSLNASVYVSEDNPYLLNSISEVPRFSMDPASFQSIPDFPSGTVGINITGTGSER